MRYLRDFHPWYLDRLGERRPVLVTVQKADDLDAVRAQVRALGAEPAAAV